MAKSSVLRVVAAYGAVLGLGVGCGGQESSGRVPREPLRSSTSTAAAALATGAACDGSGPHARHAAAGISCETCHPCGGAYGFPADQRLPGGTTTAGGQLATGGGDTTCEVGCHRPLGATATAPVSWSAPGPLACVSCHTPMAPTGGPGSSSHPADVSTAQANRAACQTCHDTGAHLSGSTRIALGDGSIVLVDRSDPHGADDACRGCHGGTGRTIAGRTPPVLVGYDDASAGDFHGARNGSAGGFGGTLAAPHARQAAPLACRECHDAHASPAPFLFRTGGSTAQISRGGVGAEAFCARCHVGERHAGCVTSDCHGSPAFGGSDPAPAGAPCLWCHGHEGIVNGSAGVWVSHPGALEGEGDCTHCHAPSRIPTPDAAPPRIVAGSVSVRGVTATTATVAWETDEPSTSWVAWGIGDADRSTGTPALSAAGTPSRHEVVLAGLEEATAYVFRVRSADAQRNVAESALLSFTTPSLRAPSQPTLWPPADPSDYGPTVLVALAWTTSTSPLGGPVTYHLQVDDAPDFATPVVDVWTASTSHSATLSNGGLYWRNGMPFALGQPYWWRVVAVETRDPSLKSAWSVVDGFTAYQAIDEW